MASVFPTARMYGSAEGPGMFLIELLETYPHYLGDQEGIGDLPFMFKVLSINKALSIQVRSTFLTFFIVFFLLFSALSENAVRGSFCMWHTG